MLETERDRVKEYGMVGFNTFAGHCVVSVCLCVCVSSDMPGLTHTGRDRGEQLTASEARAMTVRPGL